MERTREWWVDLVAGEGLHGRAISTGAGPIGDFVGAGNVGAKGGGDNFSMTACLSGEN